MDPLTLALIAAVNLLVGLCVGLTGIAGFLLPMFYSGFLDFPSSVSLALSFSAFLVSGVLGSVNYKRSGNLDLKTGCVMALGSLLGALFGVRLNLLIPEEWIKRLLYTVVLLSGISILLREYRASIRSKKTADPGLANETGPGTFGNLFYIFLGIITAAVCAASGAGGPVLVMPLLTMCGFPAHTAVGIALFDSVFIAMPAAFGYLKAAAALTGTPDAAFTMHSPMAALSLLPLFLIFHGIGVFAGSRYAVRINQKLLKIIVATGSIGIACLKLGGM